MSHRVLADSDTPPSLLRDRLVTLGQAQLDLVRLQLDLAFGRPHGGAPIVLVERELIDEWAPPREWDFKRALAEESGAAALDALLLACALLDMDSATARHLNDRLAGQVVFARGDCAILICISRFLEVLAAHRLFLPDLLCQVLLREHVHLRQSPAKHRDQIWSSEHVAQLIGFEMGLRIHTAVAECFLTLAPAMGGPYRQFLASEVAKRWRVTHPYRRPHVWSMKRAVDDDEKVIGRDWVLWRSPHTSIKLLNGALPAHFGLRPGSGGLTLLDPAGAPLLGDRSVDHEPVPELDSPAPVSALESNASFDGFEDIRLESSPAQPNPRREARVSADIRDWLAPEPVRRRHP